MAATDERPAGTELEPRGNAAIGVIGFVPRLLVGALGDLHSIAQSARVLPEVARRLASIDERMDHMDAEVTRMRQGVDAIGTQTGGVREGVERLEPHLDELRDALHPLRRTAGRMRRFTGR
jgi:hypothetical protein